jgi:hypothetical protein|tara:strand:- start:131 stop:247 length:117 start_codon:yes stop_codon:yes gene_type:complete
VKIKIEIELDTERDSQEISELIEIADRIRQNASEEYDD